MCFPLQPFGMPAWERGWKGALLLARPAGTHPLPLRFQTSSNQVTAPATGTEQDSAAVEQPHSGSLRANSFCYSASDQLSKRRSTFCSCGIKPIAPAAFVCFWVCARPCSVLTPAVMVILPHWSYTGILGEQGACACTSPINSILSTTACCWQCKTCPSCSGYLGETTKLRDHSVWIHRNTRYFFSFWENTHCRMSNQYSHCYILLVANTTILLTHDSTAYVHSESTELGNKKDHPATCGLVISNQTFVNVLCSSSVIQTSMGRHTIPEHCAQ